MGYTTEFQGEFIFDRPLDENLERYLNSLFHSRRMRRDPEKIKAMDPSWKEHCYRGILGKEGEFYYPPEYIPRKFLQQFPFEPLIRGQHSKKADPVYNDFGQLNDVSVVDYNYPPEGQPGLWCDWEVKKNTLFWNGGEKFYRYTEWLKYLIAQFFIPEGYVLNGNVNFRGDDFDDVGQIVVENNKVFVKRFFV